MPDGLNVSEHMRATSRKFMTNSCRNVCEQPFKRMASPGAGEGAMAVRFVHQYLKHWPVT